MRDRFLPNASNLSKTGGILVKLWFLSYVILCLKKKQEKRSKKQKNLLFIKT